MVMPKPDLTALTGGYRKTPVMQIGADIYCDTQCIARELEQRYPTPTLFPDNSAALSVALSRWSDAAFFQPGAGLSMGTNDALPEDILADRRAFFNFLDFSTLAQQLPHLYAQFRAQLQLVDDMLSDGRAFVLGEQPGWCDILAYFPLWMCRGNIADAGDLLTSLAYLEAWEQRMLAIGHGTPSSLPAGEALGIARASTSAVAAYIDPGALPQLPAGSWVTVTPEDYGAVPVEGELLRLTQYDAAIKRTGEQTDEVVVHFPRIGYRIKAA
jgi:glutathione S-transferase